MQLPECLLRRLTICDGQAVVYDPLRPHKTAICYCALIAEGWGNAELLEQLRWARARTVARAQPIQRAMEHRQRLVRDQADW
uniref:Uncharacterized protein n=1 Tax=uncultured prokaryote TaxID=198431 RepID=A0A0H5Q606_9ZZZZ|nr:hypothetical protein [uncultured prokaryote]